ncbi:hypothetical protein BOX37_31160 [Nocardia mangyaensis]|uniref:Minor tail protein n=1 Tax=Nocardia mangyaensis TaxID=2213200 RepID=A0A1J0W0E0_9NOCA|nr:hypothetical protein [Nocardia mangyaensis]APE37655.1 hypothetical protein BOX37_31160 [Nocardia mangyaensis]
MAELPPLEYGKVVGRFLANVADGPDIGDLPEFPPLSGRVTFTADAAKVLVAGAEPAPATYVQLPKHYECQLDEFGYLTWRGARGIRLVAPNAATNPSDWTWKVTFDLDYEGDPVPLEPFSFTVGEYQPGPDPEDPDLGSTGLIDLTLVSPVPASTGNAVVRGERGHGIQIDGQVPIYADLPGSPPDGSQYIVQSDGLLYLFDEVTGWTPPGQGVVVRGPAGTTQWAGISGKPATFPPTIGSSATTAVAGDDPRLSDARTPTLHTHPAGEITGLTQIADALLSSTTEGEARAAISAVSVTDPRLSDPRTPTAAGQAYDIAFKSHTGNRAVGAGNVMPEGVRIERPYQVSSITYRGETAGTGNLVAELRKNGTVIAGTTATIADTAHVGDTVVTVGGPWNFVAGDRLTVHITTADNPAGKGLQVSLNGRTV